MLVLSFLLLIFVNNSLQLPFDNRIIGGRNADIFEFPFIVRSFFNGRAWCGNVIINELTLISAAHCYENRNISDFKVLAGQTDVRNNQSAIQISEVIFHPEYVSFLEHDIVVLKLSEPLPPWSENVQPARLPPTGYQPLDGTHLDVSGWGDLYYGSGAQSYILQTVNLEAISNEVCSRRWGITDNHICGAGDIGRNSCNGDSGGPLSYGPMVLGLVSYGDRCDSSPEKVFTRVSRYVDFIHEHS